MGNVCILTFGTEGGKTVSLRVPRANPAMASGDVKAAMGQIIAAKAIKTDSGDINGMVKATLRYTETVDYDIS